MSGNDDETERGDGTETENSDESETEEAFRQDLKEELTAMDPVIDERLAAYFNVPETRVHSIETSSEGRYSHTDDDRGAQMLDFAGYDKTIDLEEMVVPVGQRVRYERPDPSVDFGFRIANGQGKPAEYEKIMNAWRIGGAYPNVYVHAVRSDGNELIEFSLIDMDQFCYAIDQGTIHGQGPYPAGHGVRMKYYSLPSLYSNDCILTEWRHDRDGEWDETAAERMAEDGRENGVTDFTASIPNAVRAGRVDEDNGDGWDALGSITVSGDDDDDGDAPAGGCAGINW